MACRRERLQVLDLDGIIGHEKQQPQIVARHAPQVFKECDVDPEAAVSQHATP